VNTDLKILVFGKNGQVGSSLLEIFESKGVRTLGVDIQDLDLTNTKEIEVFINKERPDWVINCAAHTAVDKAESEQKLSYLLNVDAPKAMARTCANLSIGFVHYSTDYVFDGTASVPYLESDEVNPQSVYGRTKAEGESAVLAELKDALIFRTAWVYSENGNNFVNTMLRLAREHSEISVVSDQIGSPTLARDLAQMTVNVIEKIVSKECEHIGGVFHATGQGAISWYQFCQAIMEITENTEVTIRPISTEQYPTPAPRPGYSVLSNQKLNEVYQQQLPHWKESLRHCLSGR
jgi:dTDP-4-dehydrorhamnose reductase